MSQPATVTACLIVKNEAANLPRCLGSLRGAVDEVVVIDTGSTDDTVAIAERIAAEPGFPPLRLGHHAWTDDFAAARNAAIDLATSAWILSIDADEELVVKDAGRWRKALAADGVAYLMYLANVGPAGAVESEIGDILRLFPRRADVRFEGRLHEEVSRGLAAAGIRLAGLGAASLRHHGYQPAAMPGKAARNLHLARLAAAERPDDPMPWLYAAQAAWLARNTDDAMEAIARAHAAFGAGRVASRQRLALWLVEVWVRTARGEGLAVDQVLAEALAAAPDHPEFRYERGRRRVDAGDLAGALADFTACLRADGDRDRLGSLRTGITGFLAHSELVGVAAAQGDLPRAAKHAAAAAADPNCPAPDAARWRALAAQLRQAPKR